MVDGILADIAFFLTTTLTGELALILVIKKDPGGYKLRPVEWYRDSNLEQYQKYLVVSIVAVATIAAVWFSFDYILKGMVFDWIRSFSPVGAVFYDLALFLTVVGLGTYYSREKQIDEWMLYLVGGIILAMLLWAQLTYGILNGLL